MIKIRTYYTSVWFKKQCLQEFQSRLCITCTSSFSTDYFATQSLLNPSSETQGQIVGPRESLNMRKNMAQRKVKNGKKSPWGQCLTRPVKTVATVFLAPIRSTNNGDRLELVWWDIVPRGSSRRSLLFFVPYFFSRLDFPLPLLSAPGFQRMVSI